MTAAITDKITNVSSGARPVSTTVTTLRATSATSLICADLTGWATDTAVHFITYKIDGQKNVITGSQADWKGIVSGSTINSLTLTGGTDAGNAVGDIVEILPTARWAKDLTDAIRVHSAQDGNLLPIAAGNVVPTAAIQDSAVTTAKVNNAAITYAKLLTTIFSGQVTTTTNAGNAGGTLNYINLGGIKLAWGLTASQSSGSPGNQYIVTLPTSFFTTVQSVVVTPANLTSVIQQQANVSSFSTSSLTIYFITTSAATQQVSWFVIGN